MSLELIASGVTSTGRFKLADFSIGGGGIIIGKLPDVQPSTFGNYGWLEMLYSDLLGFGFRPMVISQKWPVREVGIDLRGASIPPCEIWATWFKAVGAYEIWFWQIGGGMHP